MRTQLRPSPLSILNHEFLEIVLKASETEIAEAPLSLDFNREWGPSSNDPLEWKLSLTVRFGTEDEEEFVPYRGLLRIVGYFRINEGFPEARRDELIRITGASILYGACREMLANLTARTPHGMISLPSISFVDQKPETSETEGLIKPAAKTAKKKIGKKK